jgi:hypothetical protein
MEQEAGENAISRSLGRKMHTGMVINPEGKRPLGSPKA